MAHISRDKRNYLDEVTSSVIHRLRELECDDASNTFSANLAYVFTSMLNQSYSNGSYADANEAAGVLALVTHQLNQRITADLKQIAFEMDNT